MVSEAGLVDYLKVSVAVGDLKTVVPETELSKCLGVVVAAYNLISTVAEADLNSRLAIAITGNVLASGVDESDLGGGLVVVVSMLDALKCGVSDSDLPCALYVGCCCRYRHGCEGCDHDDEPYDEDTGFHVFFHSIDLPLLGGKLPHLD